MLTRTIQLLSVLAVAVSLAVAGSAELSARGGGGGGGGGGHGGGGGGGGGHGGGGGGGHGGGGGGHFGGGASFHGGGGSHASFGGGGGSHHHTTDNWHATGNHYGAWDDRNHDNTGSGLIPGVTPSLPRGCENVKSGGSAYRKCGNKWYSPRYQGANVYYTPTRAPN